MKIHMLFKKYKQQKLIDIPDFKSQETENRMKHTIQKSLSFMYIPGYDCIVNVFRKSSLA